MSQAEEDSIERIQAALRPFAIVAKGIPSGWLGHCKLRVDHRHDRSEYLSYHGVPDAELGLLPTIDEWREAVKVLEDNGGE